MHGFVWVIQGEALIQTQLWISVALLAPFSFIKTVKQLETLQRSDYERKQPENDNKENICCFSAILIQQKNSVRIQFRNTEPAYSILKKLH